MEDLPVTLTPPAFPPYRRLPLLTGLRDVAVRAANDTGMPYPYGRPYLLAANVVRGIEWIEHHFGDGALQQLDPGALAIANVCECVLGQVARLFLPGLPGSHRDYWSFTEDAVAGARAPEGLVMDDDERADRGFDSPVPRDHDDDDDSWPMSVGLYRRVDRVSFDYAVLDALWAHVIRGAK
jgi:hypothetical protein